MELPNPREFACYSVPRSTGRNAKTLGLKYQQYPDMGASCERPDGACVVSHSSVKLLIEQISISDRQIIPPIQESSQHS